MNLVQLLESRESAHIAAVTATNLFISHAAGFLTREEVMRNYAVPFVQTGGAVEPQFIVGTSSLASVNPTGKDSELHVSSLSSFLGEELFFYGASLPAPLISAPINSPSSPANPSFWCVGVGAMAFQVALVQGGAPLTLVGGTGEMAFIPAPLVRNLDQVKVHFDGLTTAAKQTFYGKFFSANQLLEVGAITAAKYRQMLDVT